MVPSIFVLAKKEIWLLIWLRGNDLWLLSNLIKKSTTYKYFVKQQVKGCNKSWHLSILNRNATINGSTCICVGREKYYGYSFGLGAISYASLIIWVREQPFGIYQLFSEEATSRVQQAMASYIWKHKFKAFLQDSLTGPRWIKI